MNEIFTDLYSYLKSTTKLKVSEWADKYRYLSTESSAESGKWKTFRAEYQRGILDVISDPKIWCVVLMSSAQIGKSEILNNIIGYYIHKDPAPILMVQPTLETAEDYSKTRISPMIRDTPVLKELFKGTEKSRLTSNTILQKQFPGGRIVLVGANSPSGLASKPIKIVLFDEIDRYETTKEGDPIELGIKRTQTFYNKKIIMVSTPTTQGLSRIESWYNDSDQRKYFVPCPLCDHYQILKWSNVKWDKDKPDTARYVCEKCNGEISGIQKARMIKNGKWQAQGEFSGIAGFWINELYSPWSSFEKMARDFKKATKDSTKRTLREFVNLSLGETWAEEGLTLNDNDLLKRREDYPKAIVPSDGLILVTGVDIQADRIEGEVVAYGKGEESFGIDYFIIYGSPSTQKIWDELEAKLKERYKHESGVIMQSSCVCIDSGDGNFTHQVYSFVKKNQFMRWFAIKGSSIAGKPLVSRPINSSVQKVKLFVVGTDTAKENIYARLQIDEPGHGYMHYNKSYDEEYFKQLTAEKAITKKDVSGFFYRKWVKIRPRNEALDIRVYSLAALAILNPNFEYLSGPIKVAPEEKSNNVNHRRKVRSHGIINFLF